MWISFLKLGSESVDEALPNVFTVAILFVKTPLFRLLITAWFYK